MFTLEFTNHHIWQYLQILYYAAIWNSEESSLSSEELDDAGKDALDQSVIPPGHDCWPGVVGDWTVG